MTAPWDSPVESYLDSLFNRLAGTGRAGRRMLSDAEAHLEEGAAAARERGLTEIDAERDAVARFGSIDAIARRVPVASESLTSQLRRVLVGGWALVAAGLLWYGLSGVLTWLMHWPWSQLLLATNGFGTWRACPEFMPVDDCLHQRITYPMVPAGGAKFPYAFVALGGAVALVVLLVLRATTRLGTPECTPSRVSLTLCIAVPFSAIGLAWLLYGVGNLIDGGQSRFSYVVAGGLALALAGTALKHRRHRA
jgi:hypothetical protein